MDSHPNGGQRAAVSKGLRVRVTEKQHEELKREAQEHGYVLSSFLRLRIFGKHAGMRLTGHLPVDTMMLGQAISKLDRATGELNKVASNINQVAKRINKGDRDLFMLDSSLRHFEQVCGRIKDITEVIFAAIRGDRKT